MHLRAIGIRLIYQPLLNYHFLRQESQLCAAWLPESEYYTKWYMIKLH